MSEHGNALDEAGLDRRHTRWRQSAKIIELLANQILDRRTAAAITSRSPKSTTRFRGRVTAV